MFEQVRNTDFGFFFFFSKRLFIRQVLQMMMTMLMHDDNANTVFVITFIELINNNRTSFYNFLLIVGCEEASVSYLDVNIFNIIVTLLMTFSFIKLLIDLKVSFSL